MVLELVAVYILLVEQTWNMKFLKDAMVVYVIIIQAFIFIQI